MRTVSRAIRHGKGSLKSIDVTPHDVEDDHANVDGEAAIIINSVNRWNTDPENVFHSSAVHSARIRRAVHGTDVRKHKDPKPNRQTQRCVQL